MAVIDEGALKLRLKENKLDSLYFLYGEETYTISHYAAKIISAATAEGPVDFNLSRFEGKDTSVDEICDACETLPLMSEYRCVAVNDFNIASLDDRDFKKLIALFEQPAVGTVLVFYYTGLKVGGVDKWKKAIAAAGKGGSVLKLERLSAAELQKMLCRSAAKRGCMMNTGVARCIIDTCGDSLNRLQTEVEKLCAFRNGQEITERDVELLCSRTLTSSAFDMVKAINKGQTDRALLLLSELFDQRIEPVMISGALVSSYVAMFRARAAENDRVNLAAFAKSLKVKNPKQLSIASSNVRGMTRAQLGRSLEILSKTDLMLKSSTVDRRTLLEQAVVQLIGAKKGRGVYND